MASWLSMARNRYVQLAALPPRCLTCRCRRHDAEPPGLRARTWSRSGVVRTGRQDARSLRPQAERPVSVIVNSWRLGLRRAGVGFPVLEPGGCCAASPIVEQRQDRQDSGPFATKARKHEEGSSERASDFVLVRMCCGSVPISLFAQDLVPVLGRRIRRVVRPLLDLSVTKKAPPHVADS
jgi:hypothetical protein